MAVIRTQYVKKLEEEMAKGKSFAEAHKIASKRATVKSVKRKRPEQDEGIVKRVARKLREVFYGKKTYAKKKFPPSRKRRI